MNRQNLTGVRALVTGATSGLGLAMAQGLLTAGASVVLTARDAQKLDEQVLRLRQAGLDAHGITMDVREESDVDKAVDWVRATWGRLDVLVNNAGIGMRTVNPQFMVAPQPFYEVSVQGFRDVIDTNLTGYFLVARAFAPLMVAQGYGKMINISMNHETMKRRGFIPYGPSRAGAESLSAIMAQDLLSTGVTVNMLLPGGATETGMIPEGLKSQLKGTLLQPEIMADPIVFLASRASDGITGERIVAAEFERWRTDFYQK
ncbi:MAG: SDR family NAD(P)-dependent oxidoreductase [Firmicutes bacterium]|nr:SDR family NAD(P)-dependent oxidoreductase [Bacillota bacterium]